MSVVLNSIASAMFVQYLTDISRMNNAEDARQSFSVAPAVEQKIINAYQESDEFLKKINIFPVDAQSGEKISLSVGTSIASTKNTTRGNPREPVYVGNVKEIDDYFCSQTNYDVAYKWSLLNAWRHQSDFKTRLAKMVIRAIALDKITIGFNGISRAPNSDRVANPLLQDVKRGWLQRIREVAPEQVYSGATDKDANDSSKGKKITVGGAGEFKTLDGLVETAIETFIAEQYRGSKDLVAIVGRGILADKYLPLLNNVQDPTEQIAARAIYANKVIGTLPVETPPNFPPNTILITSLDNLSIYIQTGTLVRHIAREPQYDCDVDYQSVNEDFVVEDYEKCVLLENIEVL